MRWVKASSLVLDYNIYPRHQINNQNVRDIWRAIEAGAEIPPVIADNISKRVVDGFHRVTAALRYSKDPKIAVEFHTYNSEAEMLLESMRLNAGHGQKLSAYDMARCITLGEEFRLKPEVIAAALSMTVEKLNHLKLRKTAIAPDSKLVPIKKTAGHLAGRKVTAKQLEGNRNALGHNQVFLVNQLINILENDLLEVGNKALMKKISYLYDLLGQVEIVEAEIAS